jgi:hypothetical protein
MRTHCVENRYSKSEPVLQDDVYFIKPDATNQTPMLMLCGHPGLGTTPDSRKYAVSLLRATAYTGNNMTDLSKPGLMPKASAAQSKRLETTREWVRHCERK